MLTTDELKRLRALAADKMEADVYGNDFLKRMYAAGLRKSKRPGWIARLWAWFLRASFDDEPGQC